MTEKINKGNFWSLFGKLASILATVWVLTQLYNNYLKIDYKLICKGEHYSYEMPPDVKNTLSDYVNRIALERAYKSHFKDGSRIDSIKKIDEILGKLKAKYRDNYNEYYYNLSRVKGDYSYFQNTYSNFHFSEYKSFWTFSITNDGNKPIEELILEVPYEGVFVLTTKNEPSKFNNFKNQIEIGNIKPTQDVFVKVWVKNPYYEVLEYDENKTRVTHKYGWSSIEYSKKAEGFVLWYQTNSFSGMIIFFGIIFLVGLMYFLGWQYGPILAENEKKSKLKEFEELQKLSEDSKKGSGSESKQ